MSKSSYIFLLLRCARSCSQKAVYENLKTPTSHVVPISSVYIDRCMYFSLIIFHNKSWHVLINIRNTSHFPGSHAPHQLFVVLIILLIRLWLFMTHVNMGLIKISFNFHYYDRNRSERWWMIMDVVEDANSFLVLVLRLCDCNVSTIISAVKSDQAQ